MNHLEERNQKIISAIIEKASIVCPGSIALIGINGSFMTGDFYEKSDIDLLILINDDRGWQLGSTFIQDDLQVGHDIYCTTWERLRNDARYEHPNISKLMDAKIVYCADEKYKLELEKLREQVNDKLSAPFDRGYYDKAEKLCEMIDNIITVASIKSVKEHLSVLMKETMAVFNDVKQTVLPQKKVTSATANALIGTYEEMYSNWRNKMYLAAETDNTHLAFMSLVSANYMFSEIYENVDIDKYDTFAGYNPQDLNQTARSYADVMDEYLKEYRKAGIKEKRYCDIDEFVIDYQVKAENQK